MLPTQVLFFPHKVGCACVRGTRPLQTAQRTGHPRSCVCWQSKARASPVGEITALTWALEVGDPQRFHCNSDAMSYCGLTAALKSSAGKQQRGPISKQRNRWLQTTLIEAAKLAPRWNPQLAALHARELERGHRNRATLAVARKLVTYLLAVDKSRQPFQLRAPLEEPTQKAA
jgi:transposase